MVISCAKMQICTSLQTDNHASTPPLIFLQAGCPSCHPTNCVKALKASFFTENQNIIINHNINKKIKLEVNSKSTGECYIRMHAHMHRLSDNLKNIMNGWWKQSCPYLLRSRSRSGSLRSSSDTSATTSEMLMRSSTASRRSLIVSGLHSGAHSHCFISLLPVHKHTATASTVSYLYTHTQSLLHQSPTCIHTQPLLHQSPTCTHTHSHCFISFLPVHTHSHCFISILPVYTNTQPLLHQSPTCTHTQPLLHQSPTCTHTHSHCFISLLPLHTHTATASDSYLYTHIATASSVSYLVCSAACGCQTCVRLTDFFEVFCCLSLEFDHNFCTVHCCCSAAYIVLSSLLFHCGFYLVQDAFYLEIWIYRLQRCSVMRDLVGHAAHLSAYTHVPGINTT